MDFAGAGYGADFAGDFGFEVVDQGFAGVGGFGGEDYEGDDALAGGFVGGADYGGFGYAGVADEGAIALVWVVRNGLALMVTSHAEALADAGHDHAEAGRDAWLTGACPVEDGMTFSGALRAAAARLIDSRERRTVRAESGVDVARE